MKTLLLFITISLISYANFAQTTGGNCGLRAFANVTACQADFSVYGANFGDSTTNISWDYGDGSSHIDSINQAYPGASTHTYATSGTYSVTVDIDTCFVTFNVTVTCNTTEINELDSELDFNIFPNPATTSIMVETVTSLSKTKLVISNQLGQVVKSIDVSAITGGKIPVDVNDLEKGNYFIHIKNEGKSVVKKFVKQ